MISDESEEMTDEEMYYFEKELYGDEEDWQMKEKKGLTKELMHKIECEWGSSGGFGGPEYNPLLKKCKNGC